MTTARSEVKGKSRVTRKLFILFNHYVRQTDLCWATVNTKTLFHLFSLLLFHDIFCFTNYLYFKAMSYSRSVCRLPSCAFVYFRFEIDSRLLDCISIYNAVADAYCLPPPSKWIKDRHDSYIIVAWYTIRSGRIFLFLLRLLVGNLWTWPHRRWINHSRRQSKFMSCLCK